MRTLHALAAAALFAAAAPHAAAAQAESIDVAAVGAWSYTGPTGPAFWGLPRFSYPECRGGAGSRQSPVNLVATSHAPPLPVTLNYPAGNPARLENTGHSVYLFLTNLASLQVADTTFDFRDIHFHVPAEHLVNGTRYAAEIHSVHQQGNGNRAVLTTFVTEGPPNAAWNALIAALPGNKGDTISIGPTNLTTLLSLGGLAREQMYSYAGSLTTPACTRNVRFLVRQRPINLSRQQIEALAAAFARNVRPVFPVTTPVILHRGVR
ncbi:MAG TPA: carbonic anhydrase family protein [Longimicrobium sp.]|nr:carbonic anhydrase family protein [Longimicrobium sp.]